MDNTEKLLRALIDALGFDVEASEDYCVNEVSKREAALIIANNLQTFDSGKVRLITEPNSTKYKRGDNDSYFSELRSPKIEYKLISRASKPNKVNDIEPWVNHKGYLRGEFVSHGGNYYESLHGNEHHKNIEDINSEHDWRVHVQVSNPN